MYTAVLMLAMTAGAETADHGRRGCNGCAGYYASGCHARYSSNCCGSYYRSGYYSPGYYSSGTFFYPNGTAQIPANSVRQSFYLDPGQPPAAMLRVLLPNPDAEIWFDNAPTQQRGMVRVFVSPPLDAGNYTYTIKARWTENGRSVEQERKVEIRPNQPATVDFRTSAPESVPGPKKAVPKPLPKDTPK